MARTPERAAVVNGRQFLYDANLSSSNGTSSCASCHIFGDFDSLAKGVVMIRKLFEDTIGKHGVKSFDSKGKPFDPNLHEAMGQVETSDLPPNHVVNELVRGFMLNDRLVRPALVMISKAKAAVTAPTAEPAAEPAPEPKPDENKGQL